MKTSPPPWLERIGQRHQSDSSTDIALDDPQRVIWVGTGALDLFLKRTSVRGLERRPFARIEAGASAWGIRLNDGWTLVGSPLSGSELHEAQRSQLLELLKDEFSGIEVERQLTRWLEHVNGFKLLQSFPGKSQTLRFGMSLQAESGTALVPQLPLLWLQLNAGSVDYPGGKRQDAPVCLALTPNAWVLTGDSASGLAMSSQELALADGLERALDDTLQCMADVISLRLRLADRAEWQRLATRSAQDRVEVARVAHSFRSILDTSATPAEVDNKGDALLAACRLVGQELQIEFPGRGGASLLASTRDPVALIARAAGVRTRAVALRPGWWRGDHGPLLAFHGDRCQPVALKPEAGGYTMIDPTGKGTTRVDAEVADQIDPIAQSFYRTLGSHPVSIVGLMQFVARGNHRDLLLIVLLGLLSGLVGMAGPYLTAPLFDDAIPSADRSQALQVAVALLASVLAGVMFDVTRNLSVLRVEGQSDLVAEAAVWDRLLRLPVPFFRQYSVGDLALRVNSIGAIRRVLSGTTVNSALSGVFSLVSFGLLVHFDASMAWLTAGMVALLLALMLPGTWLVLHYQRQVAAVGGQLSGLVFQLLRGIAKLRTSAAEVRAFSRWAVLFARQEELLLKANLVSAQLNILTGVFPILASCALFFAVASAQRGHGLSTGAFLAFNAAFGSFLGGVLAIFQAVVHVLSAVPMYERAKPILNAATEGATGRADPGVLAGSVEVSGLSFSYAPDSPLVLQDVSVQIQPGQFVAFVGGSGSGKSTLLRLLLGFERPNLGSIFFDGQDLAGLDVALVRRQMGVVLQNSQLMGGDISSSVCGASTLTPAEVTQALHACGMEEDIAAMPMGVHTVLPEGGTTLSGGQRQRLLLARAVATRPRLLLLDEATSALDNRSQAIVTASLDALKVTRIVVAHRLSTIVHADRIFVFDAGRVVQSGNYAELIAQKGLFADLAARQQT